jgi:hypothetical protein
MRKNSLRFSLVLVLEIMALGIGAYTLSFLDYQERSHVGIETLMLCLVGAFVGMLVPQARAKVAVSSSMIACGVAALSVGSYWLSFLSYHERAALALGVGALCLIGGIAGRLAARSPTALCCGVIALGGMVVSIGAYFLTVLGYHGRAYVAFGLGTLYLLGGLVALIFAQQSIKHLYK